MSGSICFRVSDAGARLNVKNKRGQTPLMVAMSRRNTDDKSIATTTADLLRKLGEEQRARC